jgi:hypothetical protein
MIKNLLVIVGAAIFILLNFFWSNLLHQGM